MTKFYLLLTFALFINFNVSTAQSTYTLTANTFGWNGADLTNFSLTTGTGNAPFTFIIPDGFTLSTLFNQPLLFDGNPAFEVHGSFSYIGDSAADVTIIADGTSDGTTNVTIGLAASVNDLKLTFVNVSSNAGNFFGPIAGDLTIKTDVNTTITKISNLTVGGNATFNLAGGTFTQMRSVAGELSASLSGGTLIANNTYGTVSSKMSGGTFDLRGSVTGTSQITMFGTAKMIQSATVNSKSTFAMSGSSELDLNGATFNQLTTISVKGTSKARLNNNTKFSLAFSSIIEAGNELEINGLVTVGGKTTLNNSGLMRTKGQFSMDDANSVITLEAGSSLEMPLATSQLKIGTTVKTGIQTLAGPLTLDAGSLPVELMYFKGRAGGCEVFLNWEAATEENFSHYDVQRSEDGVNFVTITRLMSDPDGYKVYQFTDEKVNVRSYYRLKMIDLDFTFKHSDVVMVDTDCSSTPDDWTIFPNPVSRDKSALNIKFYSKNQSIKLDIVNSMQQIVQSKVFDVREGWNTISWDLYGLAPGTYYIVDTKAMDVKAHRFMVIGK